MIYNIDGNPIVSDSESKPNCKIIAHRGYHVTAAQNTIDAFVAAAEAGFQWIEVDIRKCADGIYVMAHDASVTLYNNGEAVSVSIPNSNYEIIKNYTWDSAGKYKLCTLQAVFNAMMIYDVNLICDLKNGTNTDVMSLAALSGATDKVLLSYSSFSSAYNERALLLKYDNVPIRCIPSDYANYATLAGAISNPIYADVNASDTSHYQRYLNIALSCGVPILFSGCTTSNYNRWCVLANGVMANLNLNITYEQFYNLLNNDYDVVATITPSVATVSVASGSTSTLTAQSNVTTAGGYVYGYTLNPAIASVVQPSFGSSVSLTITGVSAGSTALRLFTGSGELVDIPITVT